MNWPSGDPNQPQHPANHNQSNQYPPNQYPPPQYPPAYAPPPPPPMPYQQPYGQPPGPPGGYPYPTPKKSRKGLIIALIALGVVLLGGVVAVGAVAFFAAKDRVVATDLATGDCLGDIPDSTLISVVPKVGCSEPHSGEVYAVLTMPDGDYPGEAAIDEWQKKCPPALESYSPSAMADDTIGVFVLYPTAETWATGDRAITCIATTDDKRTGSIKG